jgi:hypothetical protein
VLRFVSQEHSSGGCNLILVDDNKKKEEPSRYVEEACFYLTELQIPLDEIAKGFNLTADQVRNAVASYSERIASRREKYDEDTKDFWSRNFRESTGDVRVTLVDERGSYYHGWKSELERMDDEKLFAVLLTNKKYSDRHPLAEFSKGGAVVGYDPLVPLRRIRESVDLIEKLLEQRENSAAPQG